MKVLAGMGLVLVLHSAGLLVALGVSYLAQDYLFLYFIAGVGFFQLLYVLPLAWYLKQKQHAELLKGVLIMAGLSLLLTGLCGVYMNMGPGI
ncbi:MAG TPA: hypothetical protein V6D23_04245 [Candidatus Obscuribacterales bacterium]